MMRQSSSRNQRSKGGFRLKLVLQICLLLAICTWLLYQVKHSHDKKKAFEDNISKISSKVASNQPHLFHFGRKGLPLLNENDSISGNHGKDDDNEEERQQEEGGQDQAMKQEEAKDEEGKRDGDDAIDELDQDRGDDEEENEFFSEEDKDGEVEEDGLFDNKEVEDSAQEAREENYKRDDASSAVTHDSEMEIEDSKANDLEIAVNGTVDDAVNINNETLGFVDPISNVSNASFGENMTVINADLSVNGSHSTEVSNQNELKLTNITTESLPENNGSLAIQNGSKFNDSAVSTREISQVGRSSDLIPAQDQNDKSDVSEGHDSEDHHPPSSTTKKDDNGAVARADLSAIPVIQNEVKDYDDNKVAE